MFELKTLARKIDHPMLTLPDAPPPAARQPNQRRMMTVALALLLVALSLVIYRDRDFWFPDSPEAEDQLEPAPITAALPSQSSSAKVIAPEKVVGSESAPEKAPVKKPLVAKTQTKAPAPVVTATAAPAPPAATATRTVLPPLEVEVVAGDNHSMVNPGANSVHVELQPGKLARPAASAPIAEAPPAASVTSNAAERVQMSSGAAEVVGQPVKPGYPMLAREMRVQGSVILQALIGRDGAIQNLQVVSGPPILASAAREAVRQWHFKPHYQGSEAVETQANITVNFTISTN